MIEFLNGNIAELTPTYAVIDCSGVGYIASISLNTFSAIQGRQKALLFIHEAIREDAYQLYGFATSDEREVFRLLTSVSGVGAASARIIVSAMSPAELQNAIMGGDVKSLKGIKGIGQKTAERIIVELKEKMAKLGVQPDGPTPVTLRSAASEVAEEALQALLTLGYNKAQAAKVVDKILADNPDLKVEGVVKAAFRML
ncbi:MAG: Holliday junction branch migration protein RuvA [Bacteroidales bacterium]|nr:Holliday junction branch migration protein RuvA [Bacteroidales bacterium]MDY4175140.1 Holliday junction branch migration protein RuvA [Bacteroidales bacterium]